MGTAPREATSIPSACRSSRASPLKNSPQTLWRGVGSRSIRVMLRPFRAIAIEAAQPATPPPRISTSSCKAFPPNSLDSQSICNGLHLSSRRPKNSSARHSVQIVILEPVESWLDGCTCRRKMMPGSPGDRKASKVLDEVFDGAKQFLCSRFLGDNVGHRGASRKNFSETYPKPDASVYGGALRGWKDYRQR